ncbi:MAG TPA: hypothetical protein ENG79_08885, partial [Desulfobacteraceae bacterium]|nr:hypothetical protein [Desulfobacteraceae bacterium]
MSKKTAVSRSERYSHVMPFGTEVLPHGGVLFRLWAPRAQTVELCLEEESGPQEFFPMDSPAA